MSTHLEHPVTLQDLTTRHVRILLILAEEPRHGYVISQKIEDETDGRVTLRPGSLYRALHQLLERGLIRERNDPDEDPRRRMYALTGAGRRALTTELDGMGRLVAHGRKLGVLNRNA
jgi:DNA-binding PadR family transcriptional regulator